MDKLILLSVIFMGLYLPVRFAQHDDPRPALRRLIVSFAGFNCLYFFLLLYVYTRIG